MYKSRFIKLCLAVAAAAFVLYSSPAHAADVVSVQSISIPPYNNAFEGFERSCGCTVKQFVLSEMKHLDVTGMVRGERPDVIIAIGTGALNRVRAIYDLPIVYMMVLDTQSAEEERDNVRGISMSFKASRQLQIIHQALPEVKNVGILYHPDRTGMFVFNAFTAAPDTGIKITAGKVRSPSDVTAELRGMAGKIDALWMVPDTAVITPETVELLFLYSIEHKIPVITFSSRYLETGALMSLDIDPHDMGRQAAEMAGRILSGTDIKTIENQKAEKINITINNRTAQKLGISVSDEILNKAKVINGD